MPEVYFIMVSVRNANNNVITPHEIIALTKSIICTHYAVNIIAEKRYCIQ